MLRNFSKQPERAEPVPSLQPLFSILYLTFLQMTLSFYCLEKGILETGKNTVQSFYEDSLQRKRKTQKLSENAREMRKENLIFELKRKGHEPS